MKTTSKKIELVSTALMADGEYEGVWSGYEVKIDTPGEQHWKITTEGGLRGRAPVSITISGGCAIIKTET